MSLAGGCERVLGVENYEVMDAARPDALLRAVVASESTACSECLSHGVCARSFELCAAVPGCVELVACLFEDHPLLTDQTETTMVLSRAATDFLEYQTHNTWGSPSTPRGVVM